MKDKILDGQQIKGSRFELVIATAKRSKQINRMAKERGLPPNQVSGIRTKYIKPPTISLTEIMNDRVEIYHDNHKKIEEKNNKHLSDN